MAAYNSTEQGKITLSLVDKNLLIFSRTAGKNDGTHTQQIRVCEGWFWLLRILRRYACKVLHFINLKFVNIF